MNIFRRFAVAVSCVTSLPLAGKDFRPDELQGLSKYLPAVGILIGGLLLAIAYGLERLSANVLLSAVVLVISWIALTGGIHLDGLMDSADGIFSHRSRERMLEIMRDSRVGNFGVISGVSIMLFKIAALAAIGFPTALACVFVVPVWARWCETWAIGIYPYARDEGMGKVWHDTTYFPRDLVIATLLPVITTIGSCYLFGVTPCVVLTCFCIASGIASASYLGYVLKGHTGDTYGAVVELAEAGSLLGFALFLTKF